MSEKRFESFYGYAVEDKATGKWYSDCNYKARVWELCKKANNNGELFTSRYSYGYVVEKI